jgi:hypothetical protein
VLQRPGWHFGGTLANRLTPPRRLALRGRSVPPVGATVLWFRLLHVRILAEALYFRI